MAGPIGGRDAGGDDGVEQAGAVEVAGQVVVGGPAADFGDGVVRLDAAGAAVVCVLQADEFRADAVVVAGRSDAAHQLFDVQHAVVAFDRLGGDAEELGVGALLVADDVAIGFAEEFVAGLAVDAHAELVAHRAGGDEQSGFFAEHAGDSLFEAADGGVFAENIVANFGGGHGGAHAGGGASYGIAAEVDRRLHLGFSFRGFLARMGNWQSIIAFYCRADNRVRHGTQIEQNRQTGLSVLSGDMPLNIQRIDARRGDAQAAIAELRRSLRRAGIL